VALDPMLDAASRAGEEERNEGATSGSVCRRCRAGRWVRQGHACLEGMAEGATSAGHRLVDWPQW
jgi:hypothetical protein